MSEYITIDVEPTEAPDVVIIHTNQRLTTEGEENYESVDEGEVGSPLAQTLFSIEGIRALKLDTDAPIVLYCGSGGRAERAREALQANGYSQVVNAGGLEEAQALKAAMRSPFARSGNRSFW